MEIAKGIEQHCESRPIANKKTLMNGLRSFSQFIWLVACLCGLIALSAERVSNAKEVAVRLVDGRTLQGEVDSASDKHRLWLRSSRPGILLRSSVPRSEVLSIDDLGPSDGADAAAERRTPASPAPHPIQHSTFVNTTPATVKVPETMPRVQSLEVQAEVANWDADPETDGLRIHVLPMDERGSIVAVDGTLEARLVGLAMADHDGRDPLPELGLWSQPVKRSDFDAWGAVYNLPFQQAHPDFVTTVAPEAIVASKLGMAGQQLLHASETTVVIRADSRLRDALQVQSGKRFLDSEGAQWRQSTRWSR